MRPAPVGVVIDNSAVEVDGCSCVVVADGCAVVVDECTVMVVDGCAVVVVTGVTLDTGLEPDGRIRTSAQFINSSPPTKPSPLLAVNQCHTSTP